MCFAEARVVDKDQPNYKHFSKQHVIFQIIKHKDARLYFCQKSTSYQANFVSFVNQNLPSMWKAFQIKTESHAMFWIFWEFSGILSLFISAAISQLFHPKPVTVESDSCLDFGVSNLRQKISNLLLVYILFFQKPEKIKLLLVLRSITQKL